MLHERGCEAHIITAVVGVEEMALHSFVSMVYNYRRASQKVKGLITKHIYCKYTETKLRACIQMFPD
jgi:hypothetical protein